GAAVVRRDDRPPRPRLRRPRDLLSLRDRAPRAVARGAGAPGLVPGRRVLPVERRPPRRNGARRDLVAHTAAGAPWRAGVAAVGLRVRPFVARAARGECFALLPRLPGRGADSDGAVSRATAAGCAARSARGRAPARALLR